MARYLKGILGPFVGLVGTVVGASWKGIQVMRSRPVKSGDNPSEAQQRQRAIFTLVVQFLRPITDVLNTGFQAYNKELTPFNAAFAANMEAVTGVYPALTINYAQVMIAKGNLLALPAITARSAVQDQFNFNWVNNASPDSSNGTDMISFLAYNPAKQVFARALRVVTRQAMSYSMDLPAGWTDDVVHVWSFGTNAAGKVSSDSRYLGSDVIS
ncbi:DUF6266 family protein [Chitinophaga pinensis]|uniref:Uncharacterized protein n=1 Tax=Chitinophaga pinensis (strain ATCC 43595 / DSM 2588 / LMG 13176 / NBRC 15968 / NCIMB 11800 / UQM 2034) TaxID=485918 RepID=A0A979G4I2_CHIPD|nr:DUF6266 family protein [Chitinophaga pinensis]ACU60677.1 hypothetical protein Cpin_3210 [Chitinophaga pinensis DSM 2588]